MIKVFLGGTCNGSMWREKIKPHLRIDYFDPIVEDWTPECQARELEERATADLVLYVITPKMTGAYGVAEAVDDSNKRPRRTVFCVLERDHQESFDTAQMKSLDAVKKMVFRNGATVATDLDDVVRILNSFALATRAEVA